MTELYFIVLQAEEFQEVVTIMREFLPEAESQLKFRSLPDDEVAIMQMIEKHEVQGHIVKAFWLSIEPTFFCSLLCTITC